MRFKDFIYRNKINKREQLINKLPLIEEAFVFIYGENYREIIHNTLYEKIVFIVTENGYIYDYDLIREIIYNKKYLCGYDYDYFKVVKSYKDFSGMGMTTKLLYKEDNNIKLQCPILINLNKYYNDDQTLLHEINHALEINIINSKFNCSWDSIDISNTDKLSRIKFNNNIFTSLLLDESINDLIADDVYSFLRSLNIRILDNDMKKDANSLSYDSAKFIVKDIYNKYRDEFIYSRTYGDIDYLKNSLGEDNLKELNNIFLDFERDFYYFSYGNTFFIDRRKYLFGNDLLKEYYDRKRKLEENIKSKQKLY